MKKVTIVGLVILLFTLAFASTALAGSSADGPSGITLSYPDDMATCEPTFAISTTGVPNSFTVQYNIFVQVGADLVEIGSGTSQGNLDINFTPPALDPGTTNTYAVFIAVFSGDTLKAKLSGKWNVTCAEEPPPPPPPPAPFQGCTPGYWRQTHHFDSWVPTGYAPGDSYNGTFSVAGSYNTLSDAVWARGGGEGALARMAVAALLNAAHPDVNYAYTTAEILAGVQAAYASGNFEPFKDALDNANNAGCPLN